MITVQVENGFDLHGAEYAQLYARSAATLFQHPLWLHELYTTLAPTVDAEPLIVTGRDQDTGTLALVLPLVRRREALARRVEFADLGVCDYAMPVVDRALDGTPDAAALAPAIRETIGSTDLLVIDKVPGDAHTVATLLGSKSIRRHPYDTHPISLGSSPEQWRARLDPEFIRHLERKRERVGRRKRVLALRELASSEEVDGAFERMREFRQDRFADRRAIDLMQDPRYYDFYLSVARASADDGGPGSTSILTINDEIVGVSFMLVDDERDVGVLVGYDVAQYRNYSLGLLIVDELIAVSFANGKGFHDLTLGHEGYKLSFGAAREPMHSVRIPLTVRGHAARAAADRETQARQLAKRVLRR